MLHDFEYLLLQKGDLILIKCDFSAAKMLPELFIAIEIKPIL